MALPLLLLAAMVASASPAEAPDAAPPTAALRLDVGELAFTAATGNGILIPVRYEHRLFWRLSWMAAGRFAVGLASGAGLTALEGRLGLNWYPFRPAPLEGFFVGLQGSGAWIADFHAHGAGGPKLGAALTVGYSWRLPHQLGITAGIELSPFVGFPDSAALSPSLAAGWLW